MGRFQYIWTFFTSVWSRETPFRSDTQLSNTLYLVYDHNENCRNNKLKFINSEMKCGHALGQYANLGDTGDSWVCLDEA